MKKLLVFLLIAAMTLSLCACGGASSPAPAENSSGESEAPSGEADAAEAYDTVHIMLTCNGTDLGNDTRTAKLFAERIKEYSGGKITVDVYSNDSLASSSQTSAPELILNNTVQMDCRSTSVLGAVCENLKVSTLPFVFKDYAEAIEYTWGSGGDYYTKILGDIGLTYLGGVHNGLAAITCGKHQIKTADDLQGLKMRTVGDQNIEFYTALGASAQNMSWAEVYTAMQQGTIEGHNNSLTTIFSNNIQEVQHYISVANITYELFIFTANSSWMSGLNEATQELIRSTVKEVCLEMDAILESEEEGILETMANDYGCDIYIMTDADKQTFRDKLTDYMAKWTAHYGAEACEAFGLTA